MTTRPFELFYLWYSFINCVFQLLYWFLQKLLRSIGSKRMVKPYWFFRSLQWPTAFPIGLTGEHTAVQLYGCIHSQHVGKRLETPWGQRHSGVCRQIYLQFFRPTYYICMLAKCMNAPVCPQAHFWDRAGPRPKPQNCGSLQWLGVIVMTRTSVEALGEVFF